MRKIVSLLMVASLLVVLPAYGAKPGRVDKEEGYGYTFDDDPLSAGGFGPMDATIRVRPRAARSTLIRPRVSFMPELFKSVENL